MDLEEKAMELRRRVLDMCCAAGTGHVTSSFSCTEILVALYYGDILRYRAKDPGWPERDRFVMSKGQASPLLYTVLADLGFIPAEWLQSFCQVEGRFGVHLQHDIPGVEIISGSLGHGFGIASGMALAAKMNRDLHLVFSLLGDGECSEGSIWETAMFAAHKRLNNLVAIIDRNYLSATGFTENSIGLEPLYEKWSAFGWDARIIDGHSFGEISGALEGVRSRRSTSPLVIIANTVKGKGVPFMCDHPLWHAVAPSGDDIARAKEALGGPKCS